ncbi:periplasmic binding domain protein [Burkholderia ambifaria AMMD]|uniref:Monosaccharide ABC transporter substrate-binding protein, CUT2 family n=1 Tax=Burkholderia ambifaria (strain ATCC BAA-244 / DSM 16087 / CCUG 44356 / LMG 19182 / AMMD) TaxID=339670 RepID=Q0BAE1_BURCM|nr:sugar ABC transporter substrate-binding protein [Burkholderia ambifaria]ABI88882.1 monosaccharide ABC transporter substrate-binding protein, CUT2 family [Burkholderia ambifaria AMMD]AJY25232.1 periplasmic binding domain protein [Burkholderia ambifaria AMMD]MBR7931159.1 sugar ABC transporter substrate-binding protein [Burkholderia ambifaria]MBR8330776.1 sugar ABC transporter substrate-binding protein [Burkholderia ambifaria]MBR8342979.1 sugar ABC transporter substrate-binding protein [Burkho
MNLRKSILSCLALGTISGALSTGADAANQPHVALLMPTQSVEYWALYIKGFQKEAAADGLKVDVKVTNYDANEQATQVEQTLAQKPDVIVLVPVDSSAMVPSIRKIDQARIPLVISNSMPDQKYSRYWKVFTGPNDISNGEAAAKAMIQGFKEKGYGDKGKVIVINGPMGTPPQVQRYQGFVDGLKKNAPGIEVVGAQPADWDAVKAEAAASALFTQFKDVKGVYTENDSQLRGVVTAAQRLGLEPSKLVIVGHGCDAGGVEAISAGKAYATVEQSPFDDGAYAAKAALELATGKTPRAVQYLPNPIATKATTNVCYSQKK